MITESKKFITFDGNDPSDTLERSARWISRNASEYLVIKKVLMDCSIVLRENSSFDKWTCTVWYVIIIR